MTTHVIVNPAAGNGSTWRRWGRLESQVRAALGPCEIEITGCPGDATTRVRAALRAGAGRIVVVGGDGTVHEAVNGFFREGRAINPAATLGVLPTGTGSDLARSIGLPGDDAGRIAVLARGVTKRIDLGRVRFLGGDNREQTRLFINVSSLGLSARVTAKVAAATTLKRFGGPFAYGILALGALIGHRNIDLRLRYDDGEAEELRCALVAACNGRYCGGGLMMAPDADPGDGRFDVVRFGDIGFCDGVMWIRRLYKGEHLAHPHIELRRCGRLVAEAVDPSATVALEADGEPLGRLPAEIDIMPGALQMIVGDGGG